VGVQIPTKEKTMNEIIPVATQNINDELVQTANARELHIFLEVGKDFSTWIKQRIEQYGFVENQDFVSIPQNGGKPQGGRPTIDYHLTLDMAKELSMVERNTKGQEARRYFINCERQLKTSTGQIDWNDPKQLTAMLIDAGQKVLEQKEVIGQQSDKIKADAPKVTYYDQFANADGAYGLQNAGRALNQGPRKFIQWLKQDYLFYEGSALLAYSQWVKSGLFEIKQTIVNEKARLRTYITPKGLQYLAKKLGVELEERA
jgi:anti-repressor protein